MGLEEIRNLILEYTIEELRELEKTVSDRLREIDASYSKLSEDMGRQQRREERFEVNYIGTLTRLTDVKPGERKEYSVTINDISRSGMCLRVDVNFIPCRMVEVTFGVPGGKIKKCQLTIVRMQKRSSKDGSWLELGCQTVDKEEVLRLKWQEQHFMQLHRKLNNTGKIHIAVVGKKGETLKEFFEQRSASQRYNVRYFDSFGSGKKALKEGTTNLAIFCEGRSLYEAVDFQNFLSSVPGTLATLVMIEKEEDRGGLLQAGAHECLLMEDCGEFIFRGIERALVGQAAKVSHQKMLSGRVLIVSHHNNKINLLSFHLEENGFIIHIANTAEEAGEFLSYSLDAVFADFHPHAGEEFERLREMFAEIPVIAICDEIFYGHEAIGRGATNYLSLPLNQDDFRMVQKQILAYNVH